MGFLRVFKKKGVIALIILFVISLFLYFERMRIRDFAIREMAKAIEKSLQAEVSYEKIEGGVITGVSLFNLQIITSQGDSLKADKLSLHYDPLSILRKRFHLFKVELDSPYLFIAKHKETKKEKKEIEFPSLSITRLIIRDAKIVYESRVMGEGISTVLSLHSRKDRLQIEIFSLKGSLFQDRIKVTKIRAISVFTPEGGSIKDFLVSTQKSSLCLTSRIDWKENRYHFDIKSSKLKIEEFLQAEDIEGEIGLKGDVSLNKDRLEGRLLLSVTEGEFKEIPIPKIEGGIDFRDYIIEIALSNSIKEIGSMNLKGKVDYKSLKYDAKIELEDFLLHKFISDKRFEPSILTGAINISGEKEEGEVICQLENSIISKLPFDRISLKARLMEKNFVIDTLRLDRKDMRIEVKGEVNKDGFEAEYKIAAFPLDFFKPVLNLKLSGELKGSGRIAGKKDSLATSGVISLKKTKIEDIGAEKLVMEFNFANLLDLNGKVSSRIREMRWKNSLLGNFHIELVDKKFKIKGENGQGSSKIDGRISLLERGFECEIDHLSISLRGESIANRKELIIGKEEDLFYLRGGKFSWAGGEVDMEGNLRKGKPENLYFYIHNLNLEKAGRFLGLKDTLKGTGDFSLSVREDSILGIFLKDFSFRQASIKSLKGIIRVEGDRIFIEGLELVHQNELSKIEGTIGYTRTEKGVKWDRVDIEAKLNDPGIWVFSPLKNIVDARKGRIKGEIKIKGPLLYPELEGRVEIKDTEIWIPSVELLCSDAYLLFKLRGHKIILSEAKSRVKKGSLLATGFIELSEKGIKELRYHFQAREIPFHPMEGVYAVTSSKRFSLNWGLNRPLFFGGEIEISSALLNIPLGAASPVAATPEKEDNIKYDLRIIADKGVWLRNPDCDIEFSLDLSAKKNLAKPYFLGSFKTRQGKFYYLDNILEITEGDVIFPKSSELNPSLNIKAELLTDEPVPQGTGSERIKIILHLVGTLKEPKIELSSEPPLFSQEDIITYLNFHRTWEELYHPQEEKGEIFKDVLSEKLFWYFGKEISSQIQRRTPVDLVRIESPSPGELPTRVTVGKYISKNLFLTYTNNILDVSQDQFKAEYSLGRRSQIVGEKTPEGSYRFLYKFQIRH